VNPVWEEATRRWCNRYSRAAESILSDAKPATAKGRLRTSIERAIWAVDLLDVDAPVLHRLDRRGDLDETPRGLLGIGVGGESRRTSCGGPHLCRLKVRPHISAALAARLAYEPGLNIR
jgi:hypothetical protein